ncbi:MAG TPA: tetratricopeptide repeat protein [Terriglobales bacterium]
MFRPHHTALLCALLWVPVPTLVSAQASASGKTSARAANVASSAERAVSLAESGRCKEALPLLKQAKLQAADQDLKRRIGFAGVRCAMFAQQPDAAEDFLRLLNREFPHDPEVLYLSVHTYSDLASRAAADLAITAPQSAQGHELHAESLETNGKWDEAAKEYRLVLEQNPHLAGIHFRLGRLLLSKPNPSPADAEEAKKEMQAELEIDPSNAGAEYVLGELAKQNQQWDEAIRHFSRAAKLDASFGDAYLGWGGSLVSLKKFSEAIPPLQAAVKLQSGNPAAHYLLAIAYSRSGRKEEGDREFAIQQKLTQKGAAGEPAGSQQSPN